MMRGMHGLSSPQSLIGWVRGRMTTEAEGKIWEKWERFAGSGSTGRSTAGSRRHVWGLLLERQEPAREEMGYGLFMVQLSIQGAFGNF